MSELSTQNTVYSSANYSDNQQLSATKNKNIRIHSELSISIIKKCKKNHNMVA